MGKPAAVSLVVTLGAAAAFAPLAGRAETVRPGEPSDNIELGLFGHTTPEVLKRAKADPYAIPARRNCDAIEREIVALDEVLGPDADAPAHKTAMRARANRLIGQAMRGMIPHRDVVRIVTGADRRDKALNEAAMAGWARRGFLRGMELDRGCPTSMAAAPSTSPSADQGAARDASAVAKSEEPAALAPITPADDAAPQPAAETKPVEHRTLLHTLSAAASSAVAFTR
jgi:hypothetical protein